MHALVIVLIVLASVALILTVLVQKSKGGGLASGFSSSNQIMGVRKTTDFIEKATWGLAGAIVVLSMFSTIMFKGVSSTAPQSQIQIPTMPANTATPDVNTPVQLPSDNATQEEAAN